MAFFLSPFALLMMVVCLTLPAATALGQWRVEGMQVSQPNSAVTVNLSHAGYWESDTLQRFVACTRLPREAGVEGYVLETANGKQAWLTWFGGGFQVEARVAEPLALSLAQQTGKLPEGPLAGVGQPNGHAGVFYIDSQSFALTGLAPGYLLHTDSSVLVTRQSTLGLMPVEVASYASTVGRLWAMPSAQWGGWLAQLRKEKGWKQLLSAHDAICFTASVGTATAKRWAQQGWLLKDTNGGHVVLGERVVLNANLAQVRAELTKRVAAAWKSGLPVLVDARQVPPSVARGLDIWWKDLAAQQQEGDDIDVLLDHVPAEWRHASLLRSVWASSASTSQGSVPRAQVGRDATTAPNVLVLDSTASPQQWVYRLVLAALGSEWQPLQPQWLLQGTAWQHGGLYWLEPHSAQRTMDLVPSADHRLQVLGMRPRQGDATLHLLPPPGTPGYWAVDTARPQVKDQLVAAEQVVSLLAVALLESHRGAPFGRRIEQRVQAQQWAEVLSALEKRPGQGAMAEEALRALARLGQTFSTVELPAARP